MPKGIALLPILFLLFVPSLHAATIQTEQLTQFQSDTTAKAEEVNQNFEDLRDATNENTDNHSKLKSQCNVGHVVVGIDSNSQLICQDLAAFNARLGHTALKPGQSCAAILENGDSIGSGTYYIDPNGGDISDAFRVYCDMDTLGGGWTLCGKFDRDNAGGNKSLTTPFARGALNIEDLRNIKSFTDFQASQDCRELIRNGASQIMSLGTDHGQPWSLGRINDIIGEVRENPNNLWDVTLELDTQLCASNAVTTYDLTGTDLGANDNGQSLGDRSILTGSDTFWTNKGRNGAAFSNAGNANCDGSISDTVYWAWVAEDGTEDDHGCSTNNSLIIGTGCGQAANNKRPPTFRYNLMFMR